MRILSAKYIKKNYNNIYYDVTDNINKLINNNKLIIFENYNNLFGDPYYGFEKELEIIFEDNNNIMTKIYSENKHIILPDTDKKILYICHSITYNSLNLVGDYFNAFIYYLEKFNKNSTILCVYSFVFNEYNNNLQNYLDSYCHYNRILIIPQVIPIINEPYISMNMEHLNKESDKLLIDSQKNIYNVKYLLKINGAKKYIDYSQENISEYNFLGISNPVIFIPYLYNPNFPLYSFKLDKKYDVGFIGTENTRRSNILNSLMNNCISVIKISGWGENRDEKLAQCKILLNIHISENLKIFESIRCYPLIYNKTIVVSEESKRSDTNYYLDKFVIFEKYENLVNKIINIINNYDMFHKNIFENFDLNECENFGKSTVLEFQEFIKKN